MKLTDIALFYAMCGMAMIFIVPALIMEFVFPSQVRFK